MAVWEIKTCNCDDMDNLTIYFLFKISTRQSSTCNHLHHKYKCPLLFTLKRPQKPLQKTMTFIFRYNNHNESIVKQQYILHVICILRNKICSSWNNRLKIQIFDLQQLSHDWLLCHLWRLISLKTQGSKLLKY